MPLIDIVVSFENITARLFLAKTLINLLGFRLDNTRIPDGKTKQSIIDAIESAADSLKLQECLDIVNITHQRYHRWKKRAQNCSLDDTSSCPKTNPSTLTFSEISTIHEMVIDPKLAHFTITGLAYHAARTAKVFASKAVWFRLVKKYGWRRPVQRLHPKATRIGIRARRPDQIWHIDVTVIRLLDGSKAFVQAVIDNFSRYILDWQITRSISASDTRSLLSRCLDNAKNIDTTVDLISDGGSENDNTEVNAFIIAKRIRHIIAQVDVVHSNSMIEALFSALKHRHLYRHHLDSFAALVRLTNEYFTDHNLIVPHGSLDGAVPIDVYTGKWTDTDKQSIKDNHGAAIAARLAHNRALSCLDCYIRKPESEKGDADTTDT